MCLNACGCACACVGPVAAPSLGAFFSELCVAELPPLSVCQSDAADVATLCPYGTPPNCVPCPKGAVCTFPCLAAGNSTPPTSVCVFTHTLPPPPRACGAFDWQTLADGMSLWRLAGRVVVSLQVPVGGGCGPDPGTGWPTPAGPHKPPSARSPRWSGAWVRPAACCCLVLRPLTLIAREDSWRDAAAMREQGAPARFQPQPHPPPPTLTHPPCFVRVRPCLSPGWHAGSDRVQCGMGYDQEDVSCGACATGCAPAPAPHCMSNVLSARPVRIPPLQWVVRLSSVF